MMPTSPLVGLGDPFEVMPRFITYSMLLVTLHLVYPRLLVILQRVKKFSHGVLLLNDVELALRCFLGFLGTSQQRSPDFGRNTCSIGTVIAGRLIFSNTTKSTLHASSMHFFMVSSVKLVYVLFAKLLLTDFSAYRLPVSSR